MSVVTKHLRVAVVGGGISGLAAAWFVRQFLGHDAHITVFEKSPDIGGHVRVADVAEFPIDEGAESMLARRPEAIDLARAVGVGDDLVAPARYGAHMWSAGQMVEFPARTVMGVPSDLDTVKDFPGVDVNTSRKAEAGSTDLPLTEDVSIGSLVRSHLADGVVDRLVDPILGGVYAGQTDLLSLDSTVPELGAQLRQHSSLMAAARAVLAERARSSSPVFMGITGGVGRLPGAVARAAQATLHTNATVRELRLTSSGWELITGPVPNPEVHTADAVIVATPPVPASRLLRDVAPFAAVELADIPSSSMAVVTVVLRRQAFPRVPMSSGFLVPAVDGRTIKAVTYSSVKWPWLGSMTDSSGLVALRASVGRYGEVEKLQVDDTELVSAVMADLREAVGVSEQAVATRVTRWGGALPQYFVGHQQRIARIDRAIGELSGLAACGAAYEGVGVAACIARAREAARQVADDVLAARARIEP